jgi:putative tryptophan/tyrosine transport system substrate-binding protein
VVAIGYRLFKQFRLTFKTRWPLYGRLTCGKLTREAKRNVRRREFMTLLGGTVAAWPLGAHAQQPMPVVGFLHYASPDTLAHLAAAVRQGLKEVGLVEGQNVAIEYRWAEGHYDRLAPLAADLVRRRVNVITAGGNFSAQVAKKATSTIPIVFTSGADPVRSGLVASLSRPGGNLTGLSMIAAEMAAKRLELTRELLPHARAVAMIVNPNFAGSETEMGEVAAAGRVLGLQTRRLAATSTRGLDAAFATIGEHRDDAVMVGTDGFFIDCRDQIAALAIRYKVAGIFPFPDFPAAGGLMSYGTSLVDGYRQAGVYTGRILNGAKPTDLPVVQPTKFELVLNLRAAKAIGLTIQPMMLSRADQVIE